MVNITGLMQALEQKIDNTHILMFDLDGTLVNTNYANFLSYKKAVQQVTKLNLNWTYYPKERFTRKTLKEVLPKLSQLKYEKIIGLKDKIYFEYLDKTELNTLIVKILKKYAKTNKIVLVTNSCKERAMMVLKYHKLMDIFDNKFYKDDKDNEEISKFKYVLNCLEILPTSVVIFENEKSEIDTAILSGIPTENIISI